MYMYLRNISAICVHFHAQLNDVVLCFFKYAQLEISFIKKMKWGFWPHVSIDLEFLEGYLVSTVSTVSKLLGICPDFPILVDLL